MSRGGLDHAGARGDQGVHAGSYGMESWRLMAWSFWKDSFGRSSKTGCFEIESVLVSCWT